MLAGSLALLVAATFFGAAIYINLAEQPARLALEERALLTQWTLAYHRGLTMQAPLAVAGFLLGAFAWWQTDHPAFLAGALLMIANWPVTLLVIMPINKRLEAIGPTADLHGVRELVIRWGRLHAIRSALGGSATLAFLVAGS